MYKVMSNAPFEAVFCTSPRGDCHVEEFLNELAPKVRGKILRWIEALEAHGPSLPRPYADVVRGKVRELRIVFGGQQYRLFYFFSGKQVVMTHGFVKRTGPVPAQELARAERLMREWQQGHGR